MSSTNIQENKEIIEEIEENIKIILEQCDKAIHYNKNILIQLLKVNNNDIANCIFDIEDNNVEKKLKLSDEDIDWNKLLKESNFDHKVIRKLLDERDRVIFEQLTKNR